MQYPCEVAERNEPKDHYRNCKISLGHFGSPGERSKRKLPQKRGKPDASPEEAGYYQPIVKASAVFEWSCGGAMGEAAP